MDAPGSETLPVDRQTMPVDIACVGFGPATGAFLTALQKGLMNPDGTPVAESAVMPGMPPQVICYERADDLGFGVSGVVTEGRAIRESIPDLDLAEIPMASEVTHEEVVYLLDPIGASRRSGMVKLADTLVKPFSRDHGFKLPWIPPFLRKEPGMVFSIGQFCQWVGQRVTADGLIQVWPGTPVGEALLSGNLVRGVRLLDQGVDAEGKPTAGYMPGMDIEAALTVVGDGPYGPVGRQLDAHFGMPEGHHNRDWAVGMKFVIDLPESCTLEPGTVIHTLGYPEPEIFGFFYVYPDRVASCGIFVPSWFQNPTRTAYRYLQHWIQHPWLWKHVAGGTLRSWGAKSIAESGRHGEPFLVGDGYARIGEGSGSTNVLKNSGVDEAWATGTQLGEAVLELLREKMPFTRENLEATYVRRRRDSWLEKESIKAENARNGFQKGFIRGLIGTGLAGLTGGRLHLGGKIKRPKDHIPTLEDYYRGCIDESELDEIRKSSESKGAALHDALMDRVGWPEIPLDGKLLVSQQDALLMGGKVQAPGGYADHLSFYDTATCKQCDVRICIEACSGQAIMVDPDGGIPLFDREKCVHCGACLWNCSKAHPTDPERGNVNLQTSTGGFHSAEN
jgi:electron-transferring-flavoprotein dehydrogenase